MYFDFKVRVSLKSLKEWLASWVEFPHPEILAHQETDEATITMKLKIPTFECQNVNGNPGLLFSVVGCL